MDSKKPLPPTPWWITVLIVVCMIPALFIPFLGGNPLAGATARVLHWFYPAYVVAAGLCAWLCYPQRPALTWIILVLMILSHAGMYILITGTV